MQWLQLKNTICYFFTITRCLYPRWRYPNWRTSVVLHPCNTLSRSHIRSLYLKTTKILLDSSLGSHFESIVPVVGGFQSLKNCYYKRLVHWCMTHNKIGILGICYDENLVTRVMTDKSSISSPPSCTENSWTYDGVRDDMWYHIPEFAAVGKESGRVYIVQNNNVMTL